MVLMIDLNCGNPLFFDSNFNEIALLDDYVDGIEDSLNNMPQLLDKRAKQPHDSCGCPYRVEFLNLGINTYPSYFKEKVCDEEAINRLKTNEKTNKCIFGATCQKYYYEIKYLALINANEPNQMKNTHPHKNTLNAVPIEIRNKYHWKLRNVSIDCRCRHISTL
jgi:hypothetical protein